MAFADGRRWSTSGGSKLEAENARRPGGTGLLTYFFPSLAIYGFAKADEGKKGSVRLAGPARANASRGFEQESLLEGAGTADVRPQEKPPCVYPALCAGVFAMAIVAVTSQQNKDNPACGIVSTGAGATDRQQPKRGASRLFGGGGTGPRPQKTVQTPFLGNPAMAA